jgi:peptidoglycan/LPS O-acetylase OafA/YrhL
MLVTAGLALLSWHLVEKRALRLKPGGARSTQPAPLVRAA